ncbi:type II toxin-antitoxin system HicA family toxin [Cupriavidus sp. AcVe19-1a]|nr:type II toxin-antitoxin system HicA family toxin [Cupriavidus sp. AcVe19-1a]
MKSADLIRQLTSDGWYLTHIVGSHHQFRHPTKPGKVTVPHPKKAALCYIPSISSLATRSTRTASRSRIFPDAFPLPMTGRTFRPTRRRLSKLTLPTESLFPNHPVRSAGFIILSIRAASGCWLISTCHA